MNKEYVVPMDNVVHVTASISLEAKHLLDTMVQKGRRSRVISDALLFYLQALQKNGESNESRK